MVIIETHNIIGKSLQGYRSVSWWSGLRWWWGHWWFDQGPQTCSLAKPLAWYLRGVTWRDHDECGDTTCKYVWFNRTPHMIYDTCFLGSCPAAKPHGNIQIKPICDSKKKCNLWLCSGSIDQVGWYEQSHPWINKPWSINYIGGYLPNNHKMILGW